MLALAAGGMAVKPENPLVELGSRWTPIFADASRDFQHLAEVRSFRRTRDGLRLRARTNEGEAAEVRLSIVAPQGLRVQLVVSEAPPATTPMLVERRRSAVPITVAADDAEGPLS